jgi:hypothetical protein
LGRCGSVLGVWLVELRDGLFLSWDVLCLVGGDGVAVVVAAADVAVVGPVAAAVPVGLFEDKAVEGGYFLVLLEGEVEEPVKELLAERKDEKSMHGLQVY